ncbi:MAG: sensor histidine kinase [Halobacteriales archaeon]
MARRVNYSGLVIAGVGFFLTRFTVTLAIYDDPVRFYLAGVVPLALGLGLAVFGVGLTVSGADAALVRTTALWCVIGASTMLVLVILTLLGSTTGGLPELATIRSRTYLSNFLIGGSVGGTLTGLYASRNRRQRSTLRQQTHRLEVLNRLLRHEVLNAVAVIGGYASGGRDGTEHPDSETVIRNQLDAIERTIEEVKYLTRDEGIGASIDLSEPLSGSVEVIRDRYPDARVSVGSIPDDPVVSANERLTQVFTHLLENAVLYGPAEEPGVEVTVTQTTGSVRVSVSNEGPGLPENQQALLQAGEIEEFDDPGTGFGLNVVRLLVESYDGRIETDVDDGGSTVTVVLPRAGDDSSGVGPTRSELTSVRPGTPHLIVVLGASILAGIPYGIIAEQFGGSVAAIGVFYGLNNPVVGWLTHEFHSAVFAFVFAALLAIIPGGHRESPPRFVGVSIAIGLGWALTLWAVAAGVIAPIWLQLIGIQAPIPNLDAVLLLSHLAWGASLGLLTPIGYRYVTPWLARRLSFSGE